MYSGDYFLFGGPYSVCGLGPLSLIFCNFPAHLGPVRFQVIKHFYGT